MIRRKKMNKKLLVTTFVLALLCSNFESASSVFGLIPTVAFIALIAILFKIKKEKELYKGNTNMYGGGYGSYGGGGGGYGGYGGHYGVKGSGHYGGGGGGGYYKRSVDDDSPQLNLPQNVSLKQLEKAFSAIYKYDEQFCVPKLICEIHALSERSKYGELENGILKIFDVYHPTKPGSPGYIYRQAADFGLQASSDEACWKHFSSCEMTPPELTNLIRYLD